MKHVSHIVKWIVGKIHFLFLSAIGFILELYFRITKEKDF